MFKFESHYYSWRLGGWRWSKNKVKLNFSWNWSLSLSWAWQKLYWNAPKGFPKHYLGQNITFYCLAIYGHFLAIFDHYLAISAATATPHLKFLFFFQNKVKFGQIEDCVKFQPTFGFWWSTRPSRPLSDSEAATMYCTNWKVNLWICELAKPSIANLSSWSL